MSKRVLIYTVGISNSGKTTLCNQIMGRFEEFIKISADDLRRLIYGQVYFQSGEPYIWAVRSTILEYLLQQGQPIIIDETNTTKARREDIIKRAKNYEYSVYCLFANVTHDICIKRVENNSDIAKAKAIILNDIIMKQNHQLNNNYPIHTEGYDELFLVNGEKNEMNELIKAIKSEFEGRTPF